MANLPFGIQAILLLAIAAAAYRTLAWSLDSRILRKALRQQKLSYSAKMGMLAVVAVTIRLTREWGDSSAIVTTGIFTLLCLSVGAALVFFAQFVLEDVHEVFLMVSQRIRGESTIVLNAGEGNCSRSTFSNCRAERHCGDAVQPCGARPATVAWRPLDLPRKHQRR